MRTIALTAIIATAAAIKIRESDFDYIYEGLLDSFDEDMDREFNEEEYMNLVTYLDEDQYLDNTEEAFAREMWDIADPTDPYWLTNTISSTASNEYTYSDMDYDSFINLGHKLGGDIWELDEMWNEADQDWNGYLDLSEQDNVWATLMDYEEDESDMALDIIEVAAYNIIEAMEVLREDQWAEECDECDGTWDDWWCTDCGMDDDWWYNESGTDDDWWCTDCGTDDDWWCTDCGTDDDWWYNESGNDDSWM